MTDKKRKELLTKAKPILFNTEMVRAILDGRKTMTRCVLKPYNSIIAKRRGYYQGNGLWKDIAYIKDYSVSCCWVEIKTYIKEYAPYKVGDILYVRETWCKGSLNNGAEQYYYKADDDISFCQWQPSSRMPKEAARIFLKVTNVRIERLQEIDDYGVASEGLEIGAPFDEIWDNTVKKKDLDKYGWAANPYVWVIEFERI